METIPSKASSKWSAPAVVVLLILPLGYVASTGPAVLLVDRGWLPEPALEILYYPLILLCEKSDFISDLVDGYVDWWV